MYFKKCESFCRMCDSQFDLIRIDFARKKRDFSTKENFIKIFFMSLLFVALKDGRKKWNR